jgi:phosphopantothenoylcysteine synthetase/decarboxylase
MTEAAAKFVGPITFQALTHRPCSPCWAKLKSAM